MLSWSIFLFLLGNVVLISYLVARVLFTVLDHSMGGRVVLPAVGNKVVSSMSFQDEQNNGFVLYLKKYGLSFALTLIIGLIGRYDPVISSSLLVLVMVSALLLPKKYKDLVSASWDSPVLILFMVNSALVTLASFAKVLG